MDLWVRLGSCLWRKRKGIQLAYPIRWLEWFMSSKEMPDGVNKAVSRGKEVWREENLFAKDGSVPHHLGGMAHWDLCYFKTA